MPICKWLVVLAAFGWSIMTSVGATSLSDQDAKIEALIAQMTLAEKVGQLTQLTGFGDVTGPMDETVSGDWKQQLVRSGQVGSMLNVVGTEEVRDVQRYAVENSRLGIPVVFAFDTIHGQRTIFPLPLAEAASWDLEMMEKTARIAAIEAAAEGLNWTFAPMVDLSRDPRWGRVMEGAGEDPYLASAIAVARVKGFQGDDLSKANTIAATAKHFAGYGFAEAGKDYNAADMGTVTLFNVILPPFKAAIDQADVRTVMNGFNTVNGIPSTGDPFLQRDVLKGRWGFDGMVISDWASAREMIDHGFAETPRDAAKLAMTAGSDMDMESYVYFQHLEELVASGEVDEALVDDAVRRVLRLKFELGLFEDPYRYIDAAREEADLLRPEYFDVAREMAKRSVVLLKNEGDILPLRSEKTVAVIGALAADKDTPLGNWRGKGEAGSAVSLTEGLQAAGVEFTYAEGVRIENGEANFFVEVDVNTDDRSGFAEAIAAAEAADVVVMVLGEDAYQSGEARSLSKLGFSGLQQELLEAVHEANPNIALVVMSGRPLVLSWADENVPAIVQGWHLGHQAGHALADVLTGAYNPSGKLPMTFPRNEGQIPIYYNHLNTGRPGPKTEVFWSHHGDVENSPLYPFGHGLSYTDFGYSGLSVRVHDGKAHVSVRVKNKGKRAGEEVVQLYIRDRSASVSRPVRELKAFEKVALRPGQSKRIQFELTETELGFYGPSGDYRVEAGTFDVFVGGSSATDSQVSFDWR